MGLSRSCGSEKVGKWGDINTFCVYKCVILESEVWGIWVPLYKTDTYFFVFFTAGQIIRAACVW